VKIIWKDGYDRENRAERLVAENIRNDEEAKVMLEALQETCKRDESNWYLLKKDDYVLWRGMVEFVCDDENPPASKQA
jgi:hypothetical protein